MHVPTLFVIYDALCDALEGTFQRCAAQTRHATSLTVTPHVADLRAGSQRNDKCLDSAITSSFARSSIATHSDLETGALWATTYQGMRFRRWGFRILQTLQDAGFSTRCTLPNVAPIRPRAAFSVASSRRLAYLYLRHCIFCYSFFVLLLPPWS